MSTDQVHPHNVLRTVWKHFHEYDEPTHQTTEREKSLSCVIQSLIESTMQSRSPLPCILKNILSQHLSSADSVNNKSVGLSASPSSSSSYLDCTNLTDLSLNKKSSSSSFRSNITRADSFIHCNVKSSSGNTFTSSSGAINTGKTCPVKPLRKLRVSPPSQSQCNSVGVKSNKESSVSSVNRTGNHHHPLLTRGASNLESGVTIIPVPIHPSSNLSSSSSGRFSGMFSMKDNKKSRSMAVLPTSEEKCFPLISSTPRVSIYTRNLPGSSGGHGSSSFRVSKAARHLPPQCSDKSYNGLTRSDITSINGSRGKSAGNKGTNQQSSLTSSVSSYSINGKNQPFSYSQPNGPVVTSINNKSSQSSPGTGKVSSSTTLSSNSNGGNLSTAGASMSSAASNATGTPDIMFDSMVKKKKIRQRLLLFLRRRPTIDTLREKGIFKDEPVFGCHLANLCAREKTTVPKFVKTIINAIEAKDLRSDGIYRVCGNLSQVQKIRFQVNQDNYNGISREDDVHVLTGLLKMFFRDMKDPIFPCYTFDSLMKAISICERNGRLEAVRKVVDSLAICNFDTLKYLLQHLLRVKQMSDDNRMHIQNLAIVFGPTLMWHETEKVSKGTCNHSSGSMANNNCNATNSPSSPSITSTTAMTPFTYGNMMNGINGSFANDMLQKIKSNQLVEFLLTEFDSLFTKN